MEYLALFFLTFLAATVVPFSSEAIVSVMIFSGHHPIAVIITATLGNFSGGLTSFGLGYLGKWQWIEKYAKIPYSKIENLSKKINRWGSIAAFFTWLPFIGDLIAVTLGFLRCNVWLTSVFMFIGRFIRFVVWVYLSLHLMNSGLQVF